jgi:hypothetical protein
LYGHALQIFEKKRKAISLQSKLTGGQYRRNGRRQATGIVVNIAGMTVVNRSSGGQYHRNDPQYLTIIKLPNPRKQLVNS